VVVVRSAFDFHGDQGLYKLFDLPLNSSEHRARWAEMVGDLVSFSGGIEDSLSRQQLQKLMPMADSHPQERELQEATALSDYNIGRSCMFQDGNASAIERFDAVVARIGNDSLIAKMAIHNRGILEHQSNETDKALAAYTMMIEFHEAPDEMRACAFNNRADVYAERGDHDKAIRDRSEVLALTETSRDRRFIALIRRSGSYVEIGNDQAALDDLGEIQKQWDISAQQKANARLERALILRRLERWNEARADLQSVIDGRRLFPGTRVKAILEWLICRVKRAIIPKLKAFWTPQQTTMKSVRKYSSKFGLSQHSYLKIRGIWTKQKRCGGACSMLLMPAMVRCNLPRRNLMRYRSDERWAQAVR
jgi:tetratricopeptide (TPR) repeat protein